MINICIVFRQLKYKNSTDFVCRMIYNSDIFIKSVPVVMATQLV